MKKQNLTDAKEIIYCSYCHRQINKKEADELGYIDKVSTDIEVLYCPYCDRDQVINK